MNVSVIIPVYNAAQYLCRAVESALSQPEVAEVIIVDDGSQDGSLVLAHQLAAQYPSVEVLTHSGQANMGSAETRNVGIRAARHEYVAFIDADDWFLEGRFELTKQLFQQHPDADGVYEAVINVKTDKTRSFSKTTSPENTPDIHMVHQLVPPEQLLRLLIDDPIGIIMLQGLCVKKSLFERCGLFDKAFRISEDMLLVKKMATVGKLYGGSLTQPVSARRIHDTNISFSAYKDEDQVRHQEADVLLQWALSKPISKEHKEAIVRFYYKSHFYRYKKPFTDTAHRYKWLLVTPFLFPSLLLTRQYWSAVPIIGGFINVKET